jgi:hypothetical protein
MFADYHQSRRVIRKINKRPKSYPYYNDFGSIHLRKSVEQAVKTIVNPISAVKQVVAQTKRVLQPVVRQVQRASTSVLNPIVALKKTTQIVQQAGKTVLNPLVALKKTQAELKRSPITALVATGGLSMLQKKKTATSTQEQEQGTAQDVYQDASGNVITKEQYDTLMAQASTPAADVYQDASGNVITKEEYDRQMALSSQSSTDQTTSDQTSQTYTAPVDTTGVSSSIGPQALVSANIPQDYTSVTTDTGEDIIAATPQPIYKDQYGRITNKDGYPIDNKGNILQLKQMPEYRNTVISEINRLKATSAR